MNTYNVEYGNTFLRRFKGLMMKSKIPHNYIFVLFPCKQIHTMFMLREISIVIMDKDKIVLDKVENLKPWSFSKYYKEGYYVLELVDKEIFDEITVGKKVEI